MNGFNGAKKSDRLKKTAALLFVKDNKTIDKIIIGFDSSRQLQDILKS